MQTLMNKLHEIFLLLFIFVLLFLVVTKAYSLFLSILISCALACEIALAILATKIYSISKDIAKGIYLLLMKVFMFLGYIAIIFTYYLVFIGEE